MVVVRRTLSAMGEVFAGRYELIEVIGEGAMGTVWRVHDARTDSIVAAKVLRQSDAGALLRFMREQSTRIHHPHVVTPIGWAGEDDKVLFTMPAVEGGSLADLLRRYGSLPAEYTAEILRQLLSALAAVHDAGVIHRDVKPGNLLLEPTGVGRPFVRLTDFGVAIAADAPRMTAVSTVLGTPGFIAPELMTGADPGERTDLYAAGAVGMFALTGDSPRVTVRSAREDLPRRPAGVPDALWRVLVALLDPDPAGRPESAADALSTLQAGGLVWRAQTQVSVSHLFGSGSAPSPDGVTAADGGTAAVALHRTRPVRVGELSKGGGFSKGAGPSKGTTSTGGAGSAGTADSGEGEPPRSSRARRKGLVGLVVVPVFVVAALCGIWLLPQGPTKTTQPASRTGGVVVGDVCRWQDAGTEQAGADGQLVCHGRGQTYRWVRAAG